MKYISMFLLMLMASISNANGVIGNPMHNIRTVCIDGYVFILMYGTGNGIVQVFEKSPARHLPPQPKTCKK